MISKLLDGKCTYTPTENEIQVICSFIMSLRLSNWLSQCNGISNSSFCLFSATLSSPDSGCTCTECDLPPFSKACWAPPAALGLTGKTWITSTNRWTCNLFPVVFFKHVLIFIQVAQIHSIITECQLSVLVLLPLLQPSDPGKWSFQFSVLSGSSKGMIIFSPFFFLKQVFLFACVLRCIYVILSVPSGS